MQATNTRPDNSHSQSNCHFVAAEHHSRMSLQRIGHMMQSIKDNSETNRRDSERGQ